MGLSDQLAAMVFELRGAGSPVAKAKALARAWRMVRRLSPTDRIALAEEAGFEGAEDLLESLAAKKGGVAPALMLQFLNSLRDRGTEELSGVMAGLRDPETRDQILMRGADAVAEAFVPEETEDEDGLDGPADLIDAVAAEPEPQTQPSAIDRVQTTFSEPVVEPAPVVFRAPETDNVVPEKTPEIVRDKPEPFPAVTESAPVEAEIESDERGTIDAAFLVEDLEAETSMLDRLLCLREAVPALGTAGRDLGRLVESFPNGWARRRALTALLEAGLPAGVGDALDLIAGLERPVDRRWCLGILADRGDLLGAEAERALEMIESPTLRRRILRETPRG
ncbi:MAG: hypothetical protein DRJ65_02060 [Acidobacteria bacterium]|nr:MAG: hypothetical protein DRJ65_02060 [Acidobacteriota bacterium]